ncbi:MAG: nucleotide exchange factor GrpE [Bilifractor sp.]
MTDKDKATEDKATEDTVAEDRPVQDAAHADAAEASENKEQKEKNSQNKDAAKETESNGKSRKVKKDKKDEKIEELTDKLQRQMAEFDNFRKRTDKEKSEMFDMGARDVIEKILPVVDNFERGLAGAKEDDPFVQGMNKIYKQMTKILSDMGVEAIEAEGAEFDPNLHNAVMHEDNPDVGDNIITQELQKGYKYKDVVVRHSMVKVAN